jgi:cytochrome P450
MAATTAPLPPFPVDELRRLINSRGLRTRLLDYPAFPVLAGLLRFFRPILLLRRRGLAVVTRYDDVQEVLSRDREFPVPFGRKFVEMDPEGANFVLGMADTPEYRAVHAAIMRAFDVADLPRIGAIARETAEAKLRAGRGRIDAIADLITFVPMEIVRQYYGVAAEDPDFALWTIAMSGYSFAPASLEPALRPAAMAAAARVAPVLDAAIAAAKHSPDPGTIVGRLVAAQAETPLLTDAAIRASLSGMITGFVPTNTMAGGHILEMLLRRADMLQAATAAAQAGDADLLCRCLFEAMRFKPLNPGPFRTTAEDTVLAAGTRRATLIPKGTAVWAMTYAASFDPRRVPKPGLFDPWRSLSDTMMFGFGQHWCIGYVLARRQITETFAPLLRAGRLQRAAGPRGQPSLFGVFPEHQHVTYGA